MNQKAYLHVLSFSTSTNSESTGDNAATPRGQESAFEFAPWCHRSGCTPSLEPTPARRRTDAVYTAGRQEEGPSGRAVERGEGGAAPQDDKCIGTADSLLLLFSALTRNVVCRFPWLCSGEWWWNASGIVPPQGGGSWSGDLHPH